MLTRSRSLEEFKKKTARVKGLVAKPLGITGSYLKKHPTTVITSASLLLGASILALAGYGIYRGAKAGIEYMNSPSESEQSGVYETVPINNSIESPVNTSVRKVVFQTKPAEKVQPEFRYSGTAVDPQTGKSFRFFYAENVPSLLDKDVKVNEVEFRDSDKFNVSYRIEDSKDRLGMDTIRGYPKSLDFLMPETTIVGRNGSIAGKYTVRDKSDRFALIYKAAVEKSLEESSK